MNEPVLPFDGERFTPECVREMWYEHMHRYAMLVPLVAGRRVLDAACGEGYGSALLANAGARVLGIDCSAVTIAHARARYGSRAGLEFRVGDVTRLEYPSDDRFDLIVSFETLEHVAAQEEMLDGFARLLAADGVLVISTPDKRVYSDATGYRNPHHVRELYRDEFLALLEARFPAVRLLGQKLVFQSAIWDLSAPPERTYTQTLIASQPQAGLHYDPPYLIAVCARDAAALAPFERCLFLAGDQAESVYQHYYAEIRHHIQSGAVLIEREQEIERLRTLLAQHGIEPA